MSGDSWLGMGIAIALIVSVASCEWENHKIADLCAAKGMIRDNAKCAPLQVRP